MTRKIVKKNEILAVCVLPKEKVIPKNMVKSDVKEMNVAIESEAEKSNTINEIIIVDEKKVIKIEPNVLNKGIENNVVEVNNMCEEVCHNESLNFPPFQNVVMNHVLYDVKIPSSHGNCLFSAIR